VAYKKGVKPTDMSGIYWVSCDHKKIKMEESANIGLKRAYNFNILFNIYTYIYIYIYTYIYIYICLGFLKLSKGGIFFSHCK